MIEIEEIKQDIEGIKKRNERVEADKAWEISLARKLLIAFLTYIVVVILFLYVGFSNPFISALVPTIGFVLSTLTIPFFKNIWLKKYHQKPNTKD